MTKDEQEILQKLRDGDEVIWQAFGQRVKPQIEKSLRRAGLGDQMVLDVTDHLIVTICAAIGRLPADLNELAAPPPSPACS